MPKIQMQLRLERQSIVRSWPYRRLDKQDVPLLGRLFFASLDTANRQEYQTPDEAMAEMLATFHDEYGPVLAEGSLAIEQEWGLCAAGIVTIWESRPLLAFLMTDPQHQNQGMATFLLQTSIHWLLDQGYSELHLFVERDNWPARHLYDKLRFSNVR